MELPKLLPNKARSYLSHLGNFLLFLFILFLILYKDVGYSIGRFIHDIIHVC